MHGRHDWGPVYAMYEGFIQQKILSYKVVNQRLSVHNQRLSVHNQKQ